jgi:hypothetical protein
MDRRKFLSLGGILSASAVTGTVLIGTETVAEQQVEPLPNFEHGQLLTTESLNALVQRVNDLQAQPQRRVR